MTIYLEELTTVTTYFDNCNNLFYTWDEVLQLSLSDIFVIEINKLFYIKTIFII